MPKKERKVICPQCRRHVPAAEFSEHFSKHKGKSHKKRLSGKFHLVEKTKKIEYPIKYICDCGSQFKAREELRKHIKICSDFKEVRQECSLCSDDSQILLPYETLMLCPTCSLNFFESKEVFGIPMINHMGFEYESAFIEKAQDLLKYLDKKDLKELGLSLALITFSQNRNAVYSISHKGEAVFVLVKHKMLEKTNLETFKNVVMHELFHRYISHELKLEISDKLGRPLTGIESNAASLAEDIQLERIAFSINFEPLLLDEVNRTAAYFVNLRNPIPIAKMSSLGDFVKFQSMVSVTWTYAVESWFLKNARIDKIREIAQKNLELVSPHYRENGFPPLKDVIVELLNEKIAETEEEARIMFGKILRIYDSYLEAIGSNLV